MHSFSIVLVLSATVLVLSATVLVLSATVLVLSATVLVLSATVLVLSATVLVLSVVMSFVVPPIVRRAGVAAFRGKPQITAESLVAPFQTGHIVGMAMLEVAGFLSCIALTGGFGNAPSWFLVVPIAILVLMLIRFPRVAFVADWVSMAREDIALSF